MKDRITINHILKYKQDGKKIAALTAYDCFMAKFLDRAGIDLILVGDSLNMVIYGEETTLTVDMQQMIYHTTAVARGVKHAFLVADMPFMSYQASVADAVSNAGKLIRAGAQAVKIEGGEAYIPHIKAILDAGIPVMGHLGMTPQSVNLFGGYKLVGKDIDEAELLKKAAQKLEETGIFSLVLEKVPSGVAADISQSLAIPTIGIGAGVDCDGQILVVNDLLGLFDEFKPKFVRRYARLYEDIEKNVKEYVDDVKNGHFPNLNESYK